MSRATRRHPPSKQGRQRGGRSPVARPTPRQQRDAGHQGASSLLRPRWATDIVSELGKVTWPSREDTQYLTLVVIVVASLFGIFLGGVDIFFNWLIDRTIIP